MAAQRTKENMEEWALQKDEQILLNCFVLAFIWNFIFSASFSSLTKISVRQSEALLGKEHSRTQQKLCLIQSFFFFFHLPLGQEDYELFEYSLLMFIHSMFFIFCISNRSWFYHFLEHIQYITSQTDGIEDYGPLYLEEIFLHDYFLCFHSISIS